MKKIIAVLITVLLLTACAQSPETQTPLPADLPEDSGERLQVVATIFPQFDFVRQIAGDRVDLTMLISPGAESHSFEPSARDIITLNNADLIIYVGTEVWVDYVLASLDSQTLYSVALIEFVDVIHHDHDHDHHHGHDNVHSHDYDHGHRHDHDNGHDHDHDHGHDHHHEYDEHVWTCPRNAIIIVRALTYILAELDPGNADFFRDNAQSFIAELEALDQAYAEVVAAGVRDTIIFGDRFPFRYLASTYGLNYYAAFPGCATDTQASPATIAFLITQVREQEIPVVFHIEFSNRQIAQTIAGEAGARVLELHSAHNLSHADFNAGVTFVDIMTRNLEQLREALN